MRRCQPLLEAGSRRRALRDAGMAMALAGGLVACAALLLAGGMAAARTAWAAPTAELTYPSGSAPCNASLQECIDGATDGDTIVIAAGTYVTSFTLSKPVSLTGVASNTVILHALAGQRVLTVTGATISSSVVISGLTFVGGELSGFSCPDDCGGGLLLADSAQPLLVNVILTGNSALNGGGLYADGGSHLRMTNSQVLTNTARFNGGGVAASGAVTVNGGLFQGNENLEDDGFGGGLYTTGTLALTGTQFISNTSNESGGGAYSAGAMVLSGGRFQGNACTTATCDGGGLYTNDTLAAAGTLFIGNTAASDGGGARVNEAAVLHGGLFESNECTLDGCAGGGLSAGSTLALTGTEFLSNTARISGGGAIASGAVVLNGGRWQDNQCTQTNLGCVGGGLRANDTLALTGTHFISNTSAADGGGVYVREAAVLNGGLFQGNQCTQDNCAGGGLSASDTLALTGTQFLGNRARLFGGGAYVSSAAVFISGLFEGNACTQSACSGGGLRAGTLALTETQFNSNSSVGRGGGAFVQGEAVLNGGLLQGNQCTALGCSGGGLSAGSTLALTGTQFISNTGGFRGGGLIADGPAEINGGVFQGNQCTSFGCMGGALYHAGGAGHITNTLFANNMAVAGAALYLASPGSVSLVNNTIAAPVQRLTSAVHIISGTVVITNTLIANYATGIELAGGSASEDYGLFSSVPVSISGGVTGGAHSLTGAAGFVDLAGGNYHLTVASDAIDAGTEAGVYVDFDGQARPAGAGFDIGYDEWSARLYLPTLMRP